MDRISKAHRSWNMSRIRSKDTGPERIVRRILRQLRIRFRSHVTTLPGTPDFVLLDYKIALFVHGCFWHRHAGCPFAYSPKTRREFWNEKLSANARRDRNALNRLRSIGWRSMTVWECRLADEPSIGRRIVRTTQHSIK